MREVSGKKLTECIGDVFHVNGRECCWSGGSGNPCMKVGDEWVEYENLGSLRRAEEELTFKEITKPAEFKYPFEELVVQSDGLESIVEKVNSFVTSIYKENRTRKVLNGLKVKITNSELDGPWVEAYDLYFQSHEDIDMNATQKDKAALHACLELTKSIPTGEMWEGTIIFSKQDLHPTLINGKTYNTFECGDKQIAVSNTIGDALQDIEVGILMNSITTANEQDTIVSSSDIARLIGVPAYILVVGNDLQDGQNYMLDKINENFKKFQEEKAWLQASAGYSVLENNNPFKFFWGSILDGTPLTLEDFFEELIAFTDQYRNVSAPKTEFGSNWRGQFKALDSLVTSNSKSIWVHLINAFNYVLEIKNLLWEGFKNQEAFKESKGWNTLKLKTKDGSLKFFYK